MQLTVTIKKYPACFIPFAALSMALFRFPLSRQKDKLLYKLMGSSSSGNFTFRPDWRQWVMLYFSPESPVKDYTLKSSDEINRLLYGRFIAGWIRFFRVETFTLTFSVTGGHGSWDGFQVIKTSVTEQDDQESMAVLTRATLEWTKMFRFWRSANTMNKFVKPSPGFLFGLGAGELPFLRNVTISVWKNQQAMKSFAYANPNHLEVIKKTREEKWYREELFLRLKLKAVIGNPDTVNPLQALKLKTQMP